MIDVGEPALNGPNAFRCGPNYNYSSCSIHEKDWQTEEAYKGSLPGPCCSVNSFCGKTKKHCDWPGIDFREVIWGKLKPKDFYYYTTVLNIY